MAGELNLRFLYSLESKGSKYVIDWCMEMGMIGKVYHCPACKHEMKLVERKDVSDGYVWSCRRKGENKHHVKRSIRKGSCFEDSKLPLATLLLMSQMWIRKAPHEFIHIELHLAKQTITDWFYFCRELCMDMCIRESSVIGGEGFIVEIEENKVVEKKYNKGKKLDGQWVYGGIEMNSNKCFFCVVEHNTASCLLDVIQKYVYPGSIVVSDCWKAYDCLSTEAFRRLKARHSLTFKDPGTGIYAKSNQGTWNAINQCVQGTRHVEGHFDSHLAEYMWRRSHNDDGQALAKAFHEAIIALYASSSHDE